MPARGTKRRSVLSDGAEKRRAKLQQYPSLDAFRNPVTRSLARRFANEFWFNTHKEIDFPYRTETTTVAGVPCVRYDVATSAPENPLILYVHGGALVSGSPLANRSTILPACHLSGAQGLGVKYTLVPDGRFPKQINEIDAVYRALIETEPNRRIFVLADSAGATPALACLMKWRDDGLARPAGAILLSPSTDAVAKSDTMETLDGNDPLIRSHGGRAFREMFDFYAPGERRSDPRVSPIYGDFAGLPPLLIHVGSREVLLGEAARIAEFARRSGVKGHLRVFDGMYHLFHMHWSLDETRIAYADIADFIAEYR